PVRPLPASCTGVGPNDGRIAPLPREHARATSGERVQDDIPNAAIGPASKLPKDRVPISKLFRKVAPRDAGTYQPKHRVEHSAMIARRTTTSSDQERFEIG